MPIPSRFVSLDQWRAGAPPCHFTLEGVGSEELWPADIAEQRIVDSRGTLYRFTAQLADGLEVRAEVRWHENYRALDWVLFFSNQGNRDSGLLENIRPLHWLMEAQGSRVQLDYARGSDSHSNDFEPQRADLPPGLPVRLDSPRGRSSNRCLPFFNIRLDDRGVLGAVGWTGDWVADFHRTIVGDVVTVSAGMRKTCLRLRPGESIRTPRILLQEWSGDLVAAHNRWRQLLLEHYTPRTTRERARLPISYAVWGANTEERLLSEIENLAHQKIPVDVFWIDAGWYGQKPFVPGQNAANSGWHEERGDWKPNPHCYPRGWKPIGDRLKQLGIGFLLWFESEIAEPHAQLRRDHPDWFLHPRPDPDQVIFSPVGAQAAGTESVALLNLGNPAAREWLLETISHCVENFGLTWYRQDFNTDPEAFFAAGDSPDRIGMTEIRHVEGLYAFWDELLKRHPHLQIDNCASGGRRIDLETISRSTPLWRSDRPCRGQSESASQLHTVGLSRWVPLSAGVFTPGPNTEYAWRSAYGAGLVIDAAMNFATEHIPWGWLRQAMEEYRLVQPFFLGDFYELLDYSAAKESWTAFQFHLEGSGMAIFLRREQSPYDRVAQARLKALESDITYHVEIHRKIGNVERVQLPGKALRNLPLILPEAPSSLLIRYSEQPFPA